MYLILELQSSNLVVKKAGKGRLKVPHNGSWRSKLSLDKLVHLVKNAHEEGL